MTEYELGMFIQSINAVFLSFPCQLLALRDRCISIHSYISNLFNFLSTTDLFLQIGF